MHKPVTADDYKMKFCELNKENQQYIIAMQQELIHRQEIEREQQAVAYGKVDVNTVMEKTR